jgi:hypothetical protein
MQIDEIDEQKASLKSSIDERLERHSNATVQRDSREDKKRVPPTLATEEGMPHSGGDKMIICFEFIVARMTAKISNFSKNARERNQIARKDPSRSDITIARRILVHRCVGKIVQGN